MLHYFGYGSNMNLVSLRAKGVDPIESHRATLTGWALRFNVAHYFTHEGGVGNIVHTGDPRDRVLGVVHRCVDDDLGKLDAVEAYGVGYDRVLVELETSVGQVSALAYVGLDSFVDDSCLPTQRYLNILIDGAVSARLDKDYIAHLREHPVHEKRTYPQFEFPAEPAMEYDAGTLAEHNYLTALAGAVFDMRGARWQHEHLQGLFGGKDMTLWHLKRLDSSNGDETEEDVRLGRLTAVQQYYLNEYLHEYQREYTFAGRYCYR